jgi:hypothetical protein
LEGRRGGLVIAHHAHHGPDAEPQVARDLLDRKASGP